MKIVVASDHGGFELKEFIKGYLEGKGHSITDVGTFNETTSVDYPEYATLAANKVLSKEVDFGIIFCGTGIGISIAANKVDGIRAALCHDIFTAKMAKMHNNANILALGGRILGKGIAIEIVETYINAKFEGGRHQSRLDKITDIEKGC